jgi:ATP-binding cassette subfamily B protein
MLKSLLARFFNDPDGSFTLIGRLLREHAWEQRRRYVAAFLMMGVGAAATAATAYMIGTVVNQAYIYKNFPTLSLLCLAIVFVFTAKGLAMFGQAAIMARISNALLSANRRRVYDKLLRQNMAYFSQRHSADFVGRLNFGSSSAANILNQLVTAAGRDVLALIGLVGVMIYQDPFMSVFAFIGAPAAILSMRKIIRRGRAVVKSQFDGGIHILETMQETIQGMRVVKSFTLEERLRQRMYQNIAQVEAASNRLAVLSNRNSPVMEALGGVSIALILFYGGYRVLELGEAPGQFISFIAAFLLAYEPAKRLSRLNIDVSNSLIGVRVLFDIIDTPDSEPVEDDHPPLAVPAGEIVFDKVSFRYRPNEPVLDGMSFTAGARRLTALIGPSGGGKSTIFNMILRLYEPDSGRILIDGVDVMTRSRRSLRQQIAYVGQDAYLFRGTIRDNIGFGREAASEAEIVAAAKAAYAHDFIMSFPDGYDTDVGEQGGHLSAGQRQRISIARAFVRNTPIILLDEATASLDTESEQRIQEALAKLSEGRTTIAIAHRLNTITHADRILVVEGGWIAEQGRHADLLRKGGRYAQLYRIQFKEEAGQRQREAPADHGISVQM